MGIQNLKHIRVDIQCRDHHNTPECIYMNQFHGAAHTAHLLRTVNRDMARMAHLFFSNTQI